MKKYTTAIVWLFISINLYANDSEYLPEYLGTVPSIILKNMKQHDCEPIRNYYSPHGADYPPYVLIRRLAEYAYLCETIKEGETVEYKLVVNAKTFQGCPNVVSLPYIIGHNKPAGIIFDKNVVASPEKYYLEDGTPGGGDVLGKGIDDFQPLLKIFSDDGNIIRRICINKNWYLENGAAE